MRSYLVGSCAAGVSGCVPSGEVTYWIGSAVPGLFPSGLFAPGSTVARPDANPLMPPTVLVCTAVKIGVAASMFRNGCQLGATPSNARRRRTRAREEVLGASGVVDEADDG